jgi:Tfp pilus assembly protein PilN
MSTIQFNLLPDVKETYINAQKSRKTIITIAFLATIISIGIFVLVFFSVDVVQKAQLSNADNQVKTATAQLQNIPNINKIITIQNQLQTLSTLHSSKHAVSRIFTYMPQLTPASASIGTLSLDLAGNTLQINGTADSQFTVNAYVDTLKYATYKVNASDSEHQAFPTVTLTGFSIAQGKSAYSITATFDPTLFANPLQPAPTMIVKNQVTTRSVQDDPSNVFNGQTGQTGKTDTSK